MKPVPPNTTTRRPMRSLEPQSSLRCWLSTTFLYTSNSALICSANSAGELATISDPALKKAGMERLEKVKAAQAKATEEATAFRMRLDGFMGKVGDVMTFIGSDPSGYGVAGAKNSIAGIATEGRSVQMDLQRVIQDLNAFVHGQA